MPATPNPTIAEMVVDERLVNGDIGAAQDELVRRLQQLLPAGITAKNAAKGWTGNRAIAPVKADDIGFAPAEVTKDHVGKILVEVEVETAPEGIGGAYRNTATVTIYAVGARIVGEQQVRVHWKMAEAIRMCLYPFLSGCTDENDERVWKSLAPTGYRLAQGERFENYSATETTFTLIQSPSMNG